jgi:2-aminoadipate transaminase
MLSAIGESMGSSVTSTKPAGAMYLWVHLPEGADTTPALAKALDRGVSYRTGPAHSPLGVGSNYLRLCFGHNTDQEIREGISVLADVFTEEGLLR